MDRKTVSKLEEATLKFAIYLSDSNCANNGDGGEVSVALREATSLRPLGHQLVMFLNWGSFKSESKFFLNNSPACPLLRNEVKRIDYKH